MDFFLPGMIAGALIGAVLAWLFLRTRIEEAKNQARAEGDSERAILLERLQGREEQLKEWKSLP